MTCNSNRGVCLVSDPSASVACAIELNQAPRCETRIPGVTRDVLRPYLKWRIHMESRQTRCQNQSVVWPVGSDLISAGEPIMQKISEQLIRRCIVYEQHVDCTKSIEEPTDAGENKSPRRSADRQV